MPKYFIKVLSPHHEAGMLYRGFGYGLTADRDKACRFTAKEIAGNQSVSRWLKNGSGRLVYAG